MWGAWRADWVTQAYSPADIAGAVTLAYLYEAAGRSGRTSWWTEVRHWMDRLGLTMKGKRDLRLRLAEDKPIEPTRAPGHRGRLRLVGDAVKGSEG